MTNIKPFGKRVLVEKERLDVGGMSLSPIQEMDGQKNTGKIVAVGKISRSDRKQGIKVGATIYFRKFFVCNDGQENSVVFVDLDAITGIQKAPAPRDAMTVLEQEKAANDFTEKMMKDNQ